MTGLSLQAPFGRWRPPSILFTPVSVLPTDLTGNLGGVGQPYQVNYDTCWHLIERHVGVSQRSFVSVSSETLRTLDIRFNVV